jgi:hypothetical protein
MHHPKEWIMILGCWSSNAFLVYIRPQVLEWTNNMSCNMIKLDTFLNVSRLQTAPAHTGDSSKYPHSLNGQASATLMPKFHLHH